MNQELRELLHAEVKAHHGLISQIAERANVSQSFVSLVLKGQRENAYILDLAATMVRQAQAAQKLRQDRLNKAFKEASL